MQVGLKGQGLEVSGGGLPGTYVVEQLNLHWGSKNTRGSEHEINEKHFSMEVSSIPTITGYFATFRFKFCFIFNKI